MATTLVFTVTAFVALWIVFLPDFIAMFFTLFVGVFWSLPPTEWIRWFQEHAMPKFLSALPIRADQEEKAFVDLAAHWVADERLRLMQ